MMDIHCVLLFVGLLSSCLGSPAAGYRIVDNGMRFPRQDIPDITLPIDESGETTPPGSSPPGTTDDTQDDAPSRSVIGILLGTLAAMFVIVVALSAVAALAVVWGCKMSRRRREERELVLRTKHDIFEGVPNYTQPDSPQEDPFHNVLNSASPTSLEGSEGCSFRVGSAATETTLVGLSTEESTEVLVESRDNPGNKGSKNTEI